MHSLVFSIVAGLFGGEGSTIHLTPCDHKYILQKFQFNPSLPGALNAAVGPTAVLRQVCYEQAV